MTWRQFNLLTALVRYGPLRLRDLAIEADFPPCRYWLELGQLVDAGAISKPGGPCVYSITERGRIAWALQNGMNARAWRARQAA